MTGALIERSESGDRFADFCLWDYVPATPPAGKLRSSSLLWAFIDIAGMPGWIRDCCEAMRAALGPFQTVWGIKQREGRYSFEFYFYDYARLERTVSLGRVLACVSPYLSCDLTISEKRPYFMFSLDIGPDMPQPRRLETANIYIGNPGTSVSSGICYNLSKTGFILDNLYFFFDRTKELDHIRAKIACSVHLDLRATNPRSILWPELMDCGVIVAANKKSNDGVYFSRLKVDGFLHFLRRAAFPPDFVRFAEAHRAGMDHLLFDTGFDYVPNSGGVDIIKTAVYGLL